MVHTPLIGYVLDVFIIPPRSFERFVVLGNDWLKS